MGSASREALAQAQTAITGRLAQAAGSELLQAASRIAESPALAAALGDASAPAEAKTQLIERLFGGFSAGARSVLSAAVQGRWSTVDEFVDGVEELGLRAESASNAGLSDELLAIADVISGNHELQLSLASKLADPAGKVALISRLVDGKVSASAARVVTHLVASARGRKIDSALRRAARTAADQNGSELATVTVAAPLSADQQSRLARALEQSAGRPVTLKIVIDPSLVGGIRIQIADDIIDGSVRARLDDLRVKLAA
ncbi:F0F1 ATP synthase subunit delta [Leucobacter chromiireducens]|uniref:ATP synthase subunit delta n=1 Tax=Leucobacter chromiireducens subsp. solipictus TaxID=398235 RepID=A0ABS1SHH3_9MICO|nr:F0F1 ATP synthase subunit delta [Leucobacter chromiireducens]MBL3679925.1 F0F1 ATP synthase subunit delta [Leucobacter chromiireducens subsp. solipictus]